MKNSLSKYQKRHIESVKNKVAKAVTDYKMIDDGDKVLVAVSGGKDSLVMLETLSVFNQYGISNYDLEAIHIDVEDVPYQADHTFLNLLCESLNIKLHYKTIEAGIADRGKKGPCFVCSWHRRKALFTYATDNGFQKLALGHHLDDAVETLMINMAYHANISSIPGKLKMFDGIFHVIRPLILLTNKDCREFANIKEYPALKEPCPFEDKTKRDTAKKLIERLGEIHPNARYNLFNSMRNIDEAYLP